MHFEPLLLIMKGNTGGGNSFGQCYHLPFLLQDVIGTKTKILEKGEVTQMKMCTEQWISDTKVL